MRETERCENIHKNGMGLTIRREVHLCTSAVMMILVISMISMISMARPMARDARRSVRHRTAPAASRNLAKPRRESSRSSCHRSVAPDLDIVADVAARARAIRSQHPTPNTRAQTLGSTLDSRRETSRDGVAENGEKRECVCIRINRARGRSDRGGGVGGVHAHGRLEGAAPGVHAERAGVERIRQVSGSLDARAPAIQSVR